MPRDAFVILVQRISAVIFFRPQNPSLRSHPPTRRAQLGVHAAVRTASYAAWVGASSPVGHELTSKTLGTEKIRDLLTAQSEKEPTDVIRRLISTSYRGAISEPNHMPGPLDDRDVTRIAAAVEDVIRTVLSHHAVK